MYDKRDKTGAVQELQHDLSLYNETSKTLNKDKMQSRYNNDRTKIR